ncbi:FAD-binding oxidoreductase [Agrobacterium vitis]|uniref:NAD(P)/FAD-dependent oxidoreductase n=1 Tax=Agrobacterium vitis TaxID=373 RepID=UPI001F3E93C6|nr:FAD-dependent oxidoreductase [Agrobacterium vitis]MCF1467522.1 FAD-binding oxidoreductase [Agrobacterium vitis]
MRVDFVIIGGGIVGASAAYFLSSLGSVVLLEQEDHVGTHSSGRTAGQYTVGISANQMRALAAASRDFLISPPSGFADGDLTSRRGSLTVARDEQAATLDKLHERILSGGGESRMVTRDEALALFPALVPSIFDLGVYEVDAMDIDVNELLQAYLRSAKRNGAQVLTSKEVRAIDRQGGGWNVVTAEESFYAPFVVNAGGGWADAVASLAGIRPVGLVPYKRTAFTFSLLPGSIGADWPHVTTADYSWYVKPEPGCFMGSPADAVPVEPGDVYPDDLDVAQGIYNIEQETELRIARPLSSWAGMRSYVADRNPVLGMRPDAPGFVWLAGLGGCGVLTSPAAGRIAGALVEGKPLPETLATYGADLAALSPARAGLC